MNSKAHYYPVVSSTVELWTVALNRYRPIALPDLTGRWAQSNPKYVLIEYL